MATFLDFFWEYFSNKTLPASTLIGLALIVAITITLALIVGIFAVSTYGNAGIIFKAVGFTIAPVGGDVLELEIMNGKDVTDLVLLQAYLNGIEAEPVALPKYYAPGTVIFFTIPPGLGPGGYNLSVIGTFKDRIVVELCTSGTIKNTTSEKK